MEFRVLKYFLAAAEQENISKAAELLHVTQPTLSRQIMELEDELGVQLFIRGSRKLSLTEEGRLLKKRAEEIRDLVNKTKSEVTSPNVNIQGDIYIGGGEMDGMRFISKAANDIIKEYTGIHTHLFSGDMYSVMERLDKGLLDFGVILEEKVSPAKYGSLMLPGRERWGVLMRKDSPLADYNGIKKEDLFDLPLILSRQSFKHKTLLQWLNKDISELNVTSTYNLIYNASLMVDEGVGYAITLDKLINCSGSNLCFKPLEPNLEISTHLVWKKGQIFSKAAELLLKKLKIMANETEV